MGRTVEIVIMHIVIMHIFENAYDLGGNGVRAVCLSSKLHNAQCIIISGGLPCHLCIFGIGIHEGRHDIQVGFGQRRISSLSPSP